MTEILGLALQALAIGVLGVLITVTLLCLAMVIITGVKKLREEWKK